MVVVAAVKDDDDDGNSSDDNLVCLENCQLFIMQRQNVFARSLITTYTRAIYKYVYTHFCSVALVSRRKTSSPPPSLPLSSSSSSFLKRI